MDSDGKKAHVGRWERRKRADTFAPAAQREQRVGRLKEEATRRQKKKRGTEEEETDGKRRSLPPVGGSVYICMRMPDKDTVERHRRVHPLPHSLLPLSLFLSLAALVLIIMHFVQRCADGDAVGVRPADLRHCVAAVRSVVACIDSGHIRALYTVTSAAFPIMSGTIELVFDTTRLMK